MATVRLPEYQQVEDRASEIKAKIDNTDVDLSSVQETLNQVKAKVDTLNPSSVAEKFAANTCIVNVTVNGIPGYELPEGQDKIATLLDGAYLAVSVDGYTHPLKCNITSLVNFTRQMVVPCSTVARQGKVYLHLGRGENVAYTADIVHFVAIAGEAYNLNIQTENTTGELVEIVRIQPYNSTAAGSGASYLGTRITNANGSKLHIGENSLTSVTVYNVPKDADGHALTPIPRQIVSGGEGAVDIMERLKCLKNIRQANVTFTGDNASIDSVFMRYEQVWVKTTLEVIDGVLSVCKWFCDVQADPEYHLHPLFIRYERQDDGSIKETPTKYGYIARYPLQNYKLRLNGQNQTIAVSRPDGSNEIGGSRAQFLSTCRNNNLAKITISVHGEADVVIQPNEDGRTASMIDLREVSFLQLMSYLFFGVNSQSGMRGVSIGTTAAKEQQANGTTDYVHNEGILNGGEDTESNEKNITFLGIEGGCWSAPGIMYPNFTSVTERVTSTDANGAVASTTNNHYLVALDRLDYNPASGDEENLLESGYRRVSFNISGKNRMGYDDSQMMRDAFLPCADATQPNIHIASVDEHWQGGVPAAIATYSASATYAVNSLAIYNGKLYKCVTAVTSGEAFDEEKWALQVNETIKVQSYYMVALGDSRGNGSSLGSFTLSAGNALSFSNGSNWRSRLSLQEVSPRE